jgi:hypothetical protein
MTSTELRQQLKEAEAEEANEKRRAADERVKALSQLRARLIDELEPEARQVHTAQNERLKLDGELPRVRDMIATLSQPPDPLSYSSRASERNRLRQLTELKALQKELLLKRADCVRKESVRAHAIQLQSRIQTIEYQIKNLSVIAAGGKIGEVTGGVSQGLENFLEGSQIGPARNL